MTKKAELLAPAGNFEKLEIAIHYGADALYLSGQEFSLRNLSGNFTPEELKRGIDLAHEAGVKVYVAINAFLRNAELDLLREEVARTREMSPDAFIVADPGALQIVRETAPQVPIHLSTQANTTNAEAARFWRSAGVSRINTARELSLREISEIAAGVDIEIEAFVHGAMCISYSGRCLISAALTGRDSNRGECTQPCRWRYRLEEETRPGKYLPVMEDGRGTYIMNSRDLCMVGHIPALVEAGISSFKVEGRMKGIGYLAPVIKCYREAIDAYYEDPSAFTVKDEWLEELSRVNSWGYSTGFYFGDPTEIEPNFANERPTTVHRLAAKVLSGGNSPKVDVRNKVIAGSEIEIIGKRGEATKAKVEKIRDKWGGELKEANPGKQVTFELGVNCEVNDLLRIGEDYTHS
ncbi:MAG: peptidase U32 [Deltaproteobacteria bacterium]|nr:MAG: peptidase U32 [Deltaproteobacteria bacterium]